VSTPARTSALRALPPFPVAGTFDVDDLAVLPAPITVGERDTLVLTCRVINAADGLYGPDTATELGDEHTMTAIPFSTWGNRAPGPMRVWLPRASR